jgi:hypothetical protein
VCYREDQCHNAQALLLAPYRHVIQKLFNGEHHQDADIHFELVNGMWWQWCNQLFIVQLIFVTGARYTSRRVILIYHRIGAEGQLSLINMTDTF